MSLDPDRPLVDAPERTARPSWAGANAEALSVVSPEIPSAASANHRHAWKDDLPVARSFVRHTLSLGALASGLIEYFGWQIVLRANADAGSTVFPIGRWALGLVSNLGAGTAVGLGLACFVLLIPRFRKRPLRSASAAFAFGMAGFLSFLMFLVSRAP